MIILIIRMLFRIIRKNIQMYRMGEKEQIYQLIMYLTRTIIYKWEVVYVIQTDRLVCDRYIDIPHIA